ncbi:MAG: replicative DNA helicase, partial [Chloroflexi bacterium]
IHRDLTPIASIMAKVVDQIDFLARNQDMLMGVPTGFVMLDKMLGGFQKSDLIIVAGRPGMGKTSLGLSIAQNAAKRYSARVAIFSLEMNNEQLVQRLLSVESAIDSHRLRLGQVYDEEWPILMEAANTLAATKIFIDDTPGATVMDIRTKARRLYAEHGIDLIVIDYMQLMSGSSAPGRGENRQQEISYISRSLKELAREPNVPVVALSQLSRAVESRSDKRPLLSDLRESGCLAGDTPIYLPDEGRYVPIRSLAGTSGFTVLSIDPTTWKLRQATVSNAFCTGIKPIFRLTTRLGKRIQATANHKFLTMQGWARLDELRVGGRIAVPLERTRITEFADRITTPDDLRLLMPALAGSATRQRWRTPIRLPDYGVIGAPSNRRCAGQAHRDIYWDQIASIEPDGDSDVYDLTVPVLRNFVAGNIVVHNSIEQDADVVLFVYREDYYVEDTDRQNIADLIIAKHRHGSTGTVSLFFRKELTQFRDLEIQRETLDY